MRGFSYLAVGIPFSFNLALQYCDSKPKFLAALNKVAGIRLLLNEQIILRRPGLQVTLQAAVLPNSFQNFAQLPDQRLLRCCLCQLALVQLEFEYSIDAVDFAMAE